MRNQSAAYVIILSLKKTNRYGPALSGNKGTENRIRRRHESTHSPD